jgi:hypothetical protein
MMGVYIKSEHDYRTISFIRLVIFIYHSLFKIRTATNNNAKDQPVDLFDRLLGIGGCNMHGTNCSESGQNQ